MYIFSFFKSLFRPKNFLASIYFLANLAICFFFGYFIGSLFIDRTSVNIDNSPAIYAGLIAIAINIVIIFAMTSTMGERISRFQMGAKVLQKDEKTAQLYMIFEEVYGNALKKSPNLGEKIKLYYVPSNEVNAFALGHRSIILTQGMIESVTPNELKGIIGHEFGHLANRDGDMPLAVMISNVFIMIIVSIIKFVPLILSVLQSTKNKNIFGSLYFVSYYIFNRLVSFMYFVWCWFGMLLVNATGRKDEFRADKYSCQIGYGKDLYSALSKIDQNKNRSSFVSLLARTHPDTVVRLDKIKDTMAELEQAPINTRQIQIEKAI